MLKLDRLLISSLIVSFLIIIANNAGASVQVKNLKERTSLAGEWKLSFEDNAAFAQKDYDDSTWQSVTMPGSFMNIAFYKRDSFKGTTWLRTRIVVSDSIDRQNLGLILGRIAQADEVYFNGYKIGSTGGFPPNEFSMWNKPRHYLVPQKYIQFGKENVLAVRISYYVYGEMIGELAVTNLNDFEKDENTKNFWYITMGFIIISMGIPFAFIFLIFFLIRRNQEYLYYVLQLVFGFFIVFDLCTSWDIFGSHMLRFKVLGFAWVGLNVAHPIFLHRIYNINRKIIEVVLWTYLALVFVMLATIMGQISDQWKALALIIITTIIGGYNFSCHITALYKKAPFAKLFSFFGLTVILGAIHDGIVYLTKFSGISIHLPGFSFENMIFHYTAAVLYTGTALVLVYRFINVMDEVEDLNLNLEKKVYDRTEELSQAKDEIETAMGEMEALNENLIQTNEDLEKSERQHESDLWMASNVQAALFPSEVPVSKTYDIALYFNPLMSVSGDFYDFYVSDDTLKGAGLFDVSGHGISSALITLLAKSIVSRVFSASRKNKLNRIMEHINSEFIDEFGGSDSYVTGILLRFNDDTVEYVNSGHPDLVYKSSKYNTTVKILDKEGNSIGGPFLGIKIMNKPFKSLSFKMVKDDCLLLYSDALSETTNTAKEGYGELRIIDALQNAPDGSAQKKMDYIIKDFYDFIKDKDCIKDDMTVMVIKKL